MTQESHDGTKTLRIVGEPAEHWIEYTNKNTAITYNGEISDLSKYNSAGLSIESIPQMWTQALNNPVSADEDPVFHGKGTLTFLPQEALSAHSGEFISTDDGELKSATLKLSRRKHNIFGFSGQFSLQPQTQNQGGFLDGEFSEGHFLGGSGEVYGEIDGQKITWNGPLEVQERFVEAELIRGEVDARRLPDTHPEDQEYIQKWAGAEWSIQKIHLSNLVSYIRTLGLENRDAVIEAQGSNETEVERIMGDYYSSDEYARVPINQIRESAWWQQKPPSVKKQMEAWLFQSHIARSVKIVKAYRELVPVGKGTLECSTIEGEHKVLEANEPLTDVTFEEGVRELRAQRNKQAQEKREIQRGQRNRAMLRGAAKTVALASAAAVGGAALLDAAMPHLLQM